MVRQTLVVVHHVVMIGEPKTARGRRVIALDVGTVTAQTLKRWLARQPRAPNLEQVQAQLDRFRDYYNQQRPHRSLGRITPHVAYQSRHKAGPGTPAAPHGRIREDIVDRDGKLALRVNGRLHHIGIGRDHARTPVLMLIDDLHIRVINKTTGQLIRELNLDPTRDYQPTGKDRYTRWRH